MRGIDFAEIDFAGIRIDQEIHAEGALVAGLVELVAELLGHFGDGLAFLSMPPVNTSLPHQPPL